VDSGKNLPSLRHPIRIVRLDIVYGSVKLNRFCKPLARRKWPATVAAVRALAGVQVRFATQTTSEEYVARKLWRCATLDRCPWHPRGGCGFCRHGTYQRVKPSGTLIPRWYCPRIRRTVSALPDCLAAHYSGTLQTLEALVCAVEQAPSLAAAAGHLRTDIELPGALRYLNRLCRAIHGALDIVRGLEPARFAAVPSRVCDFALALGSGSPLMTLRDQLSNYLPGLPPPLGFRPPRISVDISGRGFQHRMGRDPPLVILDPSSCTGCRPDNQE